MIEEIQALMEDLQYLRFKIAELEMQREEAITEVLSPEQIVEIEQIKIKFDKAINEQNIAISQVEPSIKAMVTEHGESIKHDSLHAVYSKGREKWDGKLLQGYAAAHPEILEFKTTGQPGVSIRKATK